MKLCLTLSEIRTGVCLVGAGRCIWYVTQSGVMELCLTPSEVRTGVAGGGVRALGYAWSMSNQYSRAASPLTRVALAHLFELLERELGRHACDGTLRVTAKWLSDHDCDVASAQRWLQRRGGYCDCEVLLNVEPKVFETGS